MATPREYMDYRAAAQRRVNLNANTAYRVGNIGDGLGLASSNKPIEDRTMFRKTLDNLTALLSGTANMARTGIEEVAESEGLSGDYNLSHLDFLRGLGSGFDNFSAFGEGYRGATQGDVTTFNEVIDQGKSEEWREDNPVLAGAAAFVGDVFGDPLTYVPLGAAAKIAKAFGAGKKGVNLAEDAATSRAADNLAGVANENVDPALRQANYAQKQAGANTRTVRTSGENATASPAERGYEAAQQLPADRLARATGQQADDINAVRAGTDIPDEAVGRVLGEEAVAKLAKLEQRKPPTNLPHYGAETPIMKKYARTWKQNAIKSGVTPEAADAAYDAVRKEVTRQVDELDTVVSRIDDPVKARQLRGVGIQNINANFGAIMKAAAAQEMSAKELGERVVQARRTGVKAFRRDPEVDPVVADSIDRQVANLRKFRKPAPVESLGAGQRVVYTDEAGNEFIGEVTALGTNVSLPETSRFIRWENSPTGKSHGVAPVSNLQPMPGKAAVAAEEEVIEQTTKNIEATANVAKAPVSGKSRKAVDKDLQDVNSSAWDTPKLYLNNAAKILQSSGRKIDQKIINGLYSHVKANATNRLNGMTRRVEGRAKPDMYFNEMEQGHLWESSIQSAKTLMNQAGIKFNSTQGQEILWGVAEDLYHASQGFVRSVRPASVWKGSKTKTYRMPTPEEIASGTFTQKAGKGSGVGNVMFSFNRLLGDMAKAGLVSKAFKATTKGRAARYDVVAVLKAALYKSAEDLKTIADPDVRKWLQEYDSVSHVEAVTKAYTNTQNPIVESVVTQASKAANEASATSTGPKMAQDAAEAAQKSGTAAAASGGTQNTVDMAAKASKNTAEDIADNVAHTPTETGRATKKSGATLSGKSGKNKKNRASQQVHRVAAKEAEDVVPTPKSPKVAIKQPGPNAVAIDPLAMDQTGRNLLAEWFRPHFRNVTVRPVWQNAYGYIHQVQLGTSQHYKKLAKKWLNPNNVEGRAAMLSAMHHMADPSIPVNTPMAQAALADLRHIEDVVGSKLVKDTLDGTTTVSKAALDMGRANAWVRFQRTQLPKNESFFFELTDNGDWMTSWVKLLDGVTDDSLDNVVANMHSLEHGILGAATERLFANDLIYRFGKKPGKGAVQVTSDTLPYLDGAYFSKETATEISYMVKGLNELMQGGASNGFLQGYDTALRAWKTGVTIYNPHHHIRNLVGDLWLLYSDGGNMRRHGKLAGEILHKYPNVWSRTPDKTPRILGASQADLLSGAGPVAARKPNKVVRVQNKHGKTTWTDQEIVKAFHETGLAQGAENLEDITRLTKPGKLMGRLDESAWGRRLKSPSGGLIKDAASQISMRREHYVRMAHFIHGLEQVKIPPSVAKEGREAIDRYAFNNAAQRSRRWHPDGLDMTQKEAQVARRLMPFYSWQRKSIPLIMLTLARRPAMFTINDKLQSAIGYGATGQTDYLPGDELFPSWLMNDSFGALGRTSREDAEGNVDTGYLLTGGPGVPGTDLLQQVLGDSFRPSEIPAAAAKEIVGMGTPMIKSPLELATNLKWNTGQEISGPRSTNKFADYAEYLAENSPVPYARTAVQGATNKNPSSVDLLNFLLGAGLIDSSGYNASAEFDLRDRTALQEGG